MPVSGSYELSIPLLFTIRISPFLLKLNAFPIPFYPSIVTTLVQDFTTPYSFISQMQKLSFDANWLPPQLLYAIKEIYQVPKPSILARLYAFWPHHLAISLLEILHHPYQTVNVYYVLLWALGPTAFFTYIAHLYLYYTLLVPHTYASYIRH